MSRSISLRIMNYNDFEFIWNFSLRLTLIIIFWCYSIDLIEKMYLKFQFLCSKSKSESSEIIVEIPFLFVHAFNSLLLVRISFLLFWLHATLCISRLRFRFKLNSAYIKRLDESSTALLSVDDRKTSIYCIVSIKM